MNAQLESTGLPRYKALQQQSGGAKQGRSSRAYGPIPNAATAINQNSTPAVIQKRGVMGGGFHGTLLGHTRSTSLYHPWRTRNSRFTAFYVSTQPPGQVLNRYFGQSVALPKAVKNSPLTFCAALCNAPPRKYFEHNKLALHNTRVVHS